MPKDVNESGRIRCSTDGQLQFARSLDDVVKEIIDVLHENVQFFDSDGDYANRLVLDGIEKWIKEALVNCEKPSQ